MHAYSETTEAGSHPLVLSRGGTKEGGGGGILSAEQCSCKFDTYFAIVTYTCWYVALSSMV